MDFYQLCVTVNKEEYIFLNYVPGSILPVCERKYIFKKEKDFSLLNYLLVSGQFKEAKKLIQGYFRRAWWFRSQDKVPRSEIRQGGGYSISGYGYAWAYANLLYIANFWKTNLHLAVNDQGELTDFSKDEEEIKKMFRMIWWKKIVRKVKLWLIKSNQLSDK